MSTTTEIVLFCVSLGFGCVVWAGAFAFGYFVVAPWLDKREGKSRY